MKSILKKLMSVSSKKNNAIEDRFFEWKTIIESKYEEEKEIALSNRGLE